MRLPGKRSWVAVRVLALFIAAAPFVQAGEFKVNGIALDVPARFEGPTSAQPDASSQTHAFTVRATSALTAASVLQITVYGAATDAKAERPSTVSQRYLLQMLEGIERRRTEYRASAPQEIRVAGHPDSVVSWQGKANGIGTNGKMYCIVTEAGLVFFHVMGGGDQGRGERAQVLNPLSCRIAIG